MDSNNPSCEELLPPFKGYTKRNEFNGVNKRAFEDARCDSVLSFFQMYITAAIIKSFVVATNYWGNTFYKKYWAKDLDDAYQKAIRLDNDLFTKHQQASQGAADAAKREASNRAAKAAKAAAVSVKSSTPGAATSTKAQDRRSLLMEQFDNLNERF